MRKIVENELIEICKEIIRQNKTEEEWKLIESSDMFQTENYCGGYDATEEAFCFSYYDNAQEYWFQLTLDEIKDILIGNKKELDIKPADI